MDFMSGLEKFGFDTEGMGDLFAEDESRANRAKKKPEEKKQVVLESETDFIFDKKTICPVCDKEFLSKTVKASKARMIGMDRDLRPRYKFIDTIKYGVTSCPFCGYSAMNSAFAHVSMVQIKMIKAGICEKFRPDMSDVPEIYSYDYAMDKYKLALLTAMVKKAKVSEKAYLCLKMAWLCRGKIEELRLLGVSTVDKDIMETKKAEDYYYKQALEGFTKAVATEPFPICGMDQNTMDLLLAQINYVHKEYETASKLVGRLLTSQSANKSIKDKALELKDDIVAELKDLNK